MGIQTLSEDKFGVTMPAVQSPRGVWRQSVSGWIYQGLELAVEVFIAKSGRAPNQRLGQTLTR